jgi:type IV secretory pathway VirB2 component (pilin)
VTTGWGNEEAKNAVRRTLRGGRSGRVAVFVIAAACLALGIYGRSLFLSVIAGIATAAAAAALVRASYGNRAARRLERRYLASPDGDRDSN